MQTHPIGVKCPRCSDDIACTVEVKLLPSEHPGGSPVTDMRLVDLAERFAEHYRDAGHVPPPRAGWGSTSTDLIAGGLGVAIAEAFGVYEPPTVGVDFVEPWTIFNG